MTYDELCATQEDILDAFRSGELSETLLHHELEMLQEQYEDECEED